MGWSLRTNPLSPGSRSLSFALKRLSDRSFAACFRAESLSRTADGWFGFSLKRARSGSFERMSRPKRSFDGDSPVVEWGVVL